MPPHLAAFRRFRTLSWPVSVAGLVIGLGLTFRATIASGFTVIQGSFLDSRLNHFFLEHSWRWADSLGRHGLWDAPFFHPAPDTFAYSDVLLSAAPLYWGARLAELAPDASFQLWLVLCTALNFGAMLLLLRRGLAMSWLASTGGAFLFAFGAPRVAQIGRPQLLIHFWSVLAVYALVRLTNDADDAGPRAVLRVVLLFAAIVAQLYGAFYLGWFLVFAIGLTVVVALASPTTRAEAVERARSLAPALVVCGLLAAAALLPLAARYLSVAGEVGGRTYWSALGGLARPASWFNLGESSLAWGWLMDTPPFESLPRAHEHQAGIGLATAAVVAFGLAVSCRHRWSKIAAGSALALVLAVSFVHPSASPWRLVHAVVPGAEAIRTPVRMILVLLIPAAVWFGRAIDRAERRHVLLAVGLVALMAVEQIRSTDSYESDRYRERVERVASGIDPGCDAFYHSVRTDAAMPDGDWWGHYAERQLDAKWAALATGVPTLNGYSGNRPPGWSLRDNIVWHGEGAAPLEGEITNWMRRNDLQEVCHVKVRYDRSRSETAR